MSKPISFKANAHLLKLLGDELIGNDQLAIFELVKNSYDADATKVEVVLNIENQEPNIIITDNGNGMDLDVIENKWMEIGTDSKRAKNKKHSPHFNRLPLGEKGVGRLAVHKLGSVMKINSRMEGKSEVQISIDWSQLINEATYIEDTKVIIDELENPKYFPGSLTGTRVFIESLRKDSWSRGDLRKLHKLVTSLISPFNKLSDFDISLSVPKKREKDLSDMPDTEEILKNAIWTYEFNLDEDANFSYKYNFHVKNFSGLDNSIFKEKTKLDLISPDKLRFLPTASFLEEKFTDFGKNKKNLFVNSRILKGIGPISGKLYVYSKDGRLNSKSGALQVVQKYLKEQSGVRIYRDGIRVFNYGELDDDWLDLNANRINNPGKKIGTNQVIGNFNLSLADSYGLKEKTNREGFDEDEVYSLFKWIAVSIIENFSITHQKDRETLALQLKNSNSKKKNSFNIDNNITTLREIIKDKKVGDEALGKLNEIEDGYKQMREVALNSGIAGINLAIVFHEIEKGIDDLSENIDYELNYRDLREKIEHVAQLLEGLSPLLKRSEYKTFNASKLIEGMTRMHRYRFRRHDIVFSNPIETNECPDFKIKAPSNLLVGALSNIIENSIHWTKDKKNKEEGSTYTPAIKIITLPDFLDESPAIAILDNGPGFDLDPDDAVDAFMTTRPGGMGLGLYYVKQIMESIGGQLLITSAEDLDLDLNYHGAVVVMIFKKV